MEHANHQTTSNTTMPEHQTLSQQLEHALHRATLLTTEEWRMVHNALATYQLQFGDLVEEGEQLSIYTLQMRQKLQQLMDKIRDNFIK